MEGCAGRLSHYDTLSASLGQGNSDQAVSIIEKAEADYGSNSRLLFLMDRGMTLHFPRKKKTSDEINQVPTHKDYQGRA